MYVVFFFFQAEDGIRDIGVTGVQTCALPIFRDLRGLLDSAVRLHMRADVPVGTCLSGGIDSSALVCFMSDLHPEPIHTFSGLYKGKDYDEEEYVHAVREHARAYGADIRREPDGNLLDDLATITWHQDM